MPTPTLDLKKGQEDNVLNDYFTLLESKNPSEALKKGINKFRAIVDSSKSMSGIHKKLNKLERKKICNLETQTTEKQLGISQKAPEKNSSSFRKMKK